MEKIDPLTVFSGVILTIAGFILSIISLSIWQIIFLAIPVLIIGIATLFTLRKQEAIEQIEKDKYLKHKITK